jgi:hypothetical protein
MMGDLEGCPQVKPQELMLLEAYTAAYHFSEGNADRANPMPRVDCDQRVVGEPAARGVGDDMFLMKDAGPADAADPRTRAAWFLERY